MRNDAIWREIEALQQRLDALVQRLESSEHDVAPPAADVSYTPPPTNPTADSESYTEVARESFDTRLGMRWMVVVGVIAVVIAMGYEVRIAIERGWLSESVRCAAASLAGLAMFLTGGGLRRRFVRYGEMLMSGGVVAMLLGIYAAHGLYGLIDTPTTLAAVAVTALGSALLSWRAAAQAPLYLGMVGMYAAPILIGSLEHSLRYFLIYLMCVNCAYLVLSLVTRLMPLHLLALYLATGLFCLGYYQGNHNDLWQLAFIYQVGQFLAFGLVALLPAYLKRRALGHGETWLLFPGMLAFYFIGGDLLLDHASEWHLAFGLATAVCVLGLAQMGRRSLGLPLKTHAPSVMAASGALIVAFHLIYQECGRHNLQILLNWLLYGWLVVAVAVQRCFSPAKMPAFLVWSGLAWIILKFNLNFGYHADDLVTPFINSQFILLLLVGGPLLWAGVRDNSQRADSAGLSLLGHGMMLSALYQQVGRLDMQPYAPFIVTLLWVLYAAVVFGLGHKPKLAALKRQSLWIFALCSFKVFLYDTLSSSTVVKMFSYLVLGVVLIVAGYFYQRQRLRTK